MKVIYIISFAIATLSLTNCGDAKQESDNSKSESNTSPTSDHFIIEGEMLNGAGATVYLYKFAEGMPVALDSSKVGENNKFSLSKPQNGYEFLGLGMSLKTVALILANNGQQINIKGSKETWGFDNVVTGTTENEELTQYVAKRNSIFKTMQELNIKMQTTDVNDQTTVDEYIAQGEIKRKEFEDYKYNFISENINSPVVFIAFQDIHDPVKDIAILQQMESTMNKYMPGTVYSEVVTKRITQVKQQQLMETTMQQQKTTGGLSIGATAPELNFPDPNGKNIALSSLKGKVVLLDFWASWCGPCRKENPNVVNLYNKYKDKGFTVYSYSLDNNKAKWLQAIEVDGLIWPNHVSDLKGWNGIGAGIYNINSIPQTYLLDKDGKIIATGLRGAALEQKLKEIL